MRVPSPAAGMITITFMSGEKYNNFQIVSLRSTPLDITWRGRLRVLPLHRARRASQPRPYEILTLLGKLLNW
jgi:hypothetical protein